MTDLTAIIKTKKMDATTYDNYKKVVVSNGNNGIEDAISKFSLVEFDETATRNIANERIHLIIETQNDGTGDYGWIRTYIEIFISMGYTAKNIAVWIINYALDPLPATDEINDLIKLNNCRNKTANTIPRSGETNTLPETIPTSG